MDKEICIGSGKLESWKLRVNILIVKILNLVSRWKLSGKLAESFQSYQTSFHKKTSVTLVIVEVSKFTKFPPPKSINKWNTNIF